MRPGAPGVPPDVFRAAQAVAGVSLGAYLQSDALRALASSWLPVALVVLLAATTPATLLDTYLATTPGGLYAVLAVAFTAGASTTFIVAVQTLRIIAMVLLAPVAVRVMPARTSVARR